MANLSHLKKLLLRQKCIHLAAKATTYLPHVTRMPQGSRLQSHPPIPSLPHRTNHQRNSKVNTYHAVISPHHLKSLSLTHIMPLGFTLMVNETHHGLPTHLHDSPTTVLLEAPPTPLRSFEVVTAIGHFNIKTIEPPFVSRTTSLSSKLQPLIMPLAPSSSSGERAMPSLPL